MRTDSGARQPLSLLICLLTPVVILLMGVIASLVIVLKASSDLRSESGRGLLPDGFEVSLSESGDYTVWWLPTVVFEGQEHGITEGGESGRLPEGARIMLYRKGESETLELRSMVTGSRKIDGEDAISLGSFTATRPIDVEVKSTGLTQPTVISIAPVKVHKLLGMAFSIGVVMVIDVLVSIVVLFALLHRRKAAIDESAGVHSHAPVGLAPPDE